MRIWLVQPGEPLPIEEKCSRLLRTGLLAEELTRRGHEVLWWASSFSHLQKKYIRPRAELVDSGHGLAIQLLHSLPYYKNVSLRRILHHRGLARQFSRSAGAFATPDLIVSSYPPIELSRAAVDYGHLTGVPVVVDVRDLWPDSLLGVIPAGLRDTGRVVLRSMYRDASVALGNCRHIIAISGQYLEWSLAMGQRRRTPMDRVFELGYPRPQVSKKNLQEASSSLKARGVDPDKMIVWFIGTFGRSYDLRTVIDAAKLIGRNEGGIQFVLSGDGDQMEALKRRARGATNILFTGWIGASEIGCLLEWADVGLAAYIPDATQGLPNKVFEYLCGGLPIFNSLKGETADLVETHDCGVTYHGAEELALALRTAMRNPGQLRRQGANGRHLFEDRFDAAAIYCRLADYLEKTASTTPTFA